MAKAKKKVVKNKPLKKVSKKKVVAKKVSVRKAPVRSASGKKTIIKQRGSNWIWFLNILYFALFGYSGYLIWAVDWVQGVSLIVLLLGIILVARIIKKVR